MYWRTSWRQVSVALPTDRSAAGLCGARQSSRLRTLPLLLVGSAMALILLRSCCCCRAPPPPTPLFLTPRPTHPILVRTPRPACLQREDKERQKARKAAGKQAKPLWEEDGKRRSLLDKYDEEEEQMMQVGRAFVCVRVCGGGGKGGMVVVVAWSCWPC